MEFESASYFNVFDIELFEGVLKSHIYPRHYHDCYTIIFIEKGSMKYVYLDNEIIVKAKQIHVINPFVTHSNYPITNCEYKAIFLPLNTFTQLENNYQLIYFEESVIKDKLFFSKLNEFFSKAKAISSEKLLEKAKIDLRQAIFQYLSFTTKTLLIDKRIISAIEFINKNLDKKLSVKEIAAKSFLSPYHFQRTFKAAIGLTVNDFIQQQRTDLGKKLIGKGKQIADTAFEVGYFDQSHFNKSFKKMWVAKPSDFK